MTSGTPTVLILGAGINGCAIARELALNGVGVWLVDQHDIASGATSGSSRLIHGGLRYLEYGEFDLVKESLAERTRLLRLAPQFVRPLRLWIPAANRFGGLVPAVGKFFGWRWWPQPQVQRGSALVRAGLAFYDAYAQDNTLPRHTCGPAHVAEAPAFDRQAYRRLCSYYDGQVEFPERLVLSMLTDARDICRERGLDFRLFTYHRAHLHGDTAEISPVESLPRGTIVDANPKTLRPDLIINATGAWVDETLKRLEIPADRLMGGTKGSHLFTFSPRLREQLGGEQGVYAEARDGRPIFITPLGHTMLIGTTDVHFQGSPDTARATDEEVEYLLDSVNEILPGARLSSDDVNFHYSAVRPLPYVDARTTAAITRRHFFVENAKRPVPLISIIGGKLTTMRSLAEQATANVLGHLGRGVTANSEERPFPGGVDYPRGAEAVADAQQAIAERTGYATASIAECWTLAGTDCESILAADADRELLAGSDLPLAMARHSVATEHVATLADLVERRLMLLYDERLSRAALAQLAGLLAQQGRLAADHVDQAVDDEVQRLKQHYGKTVA